MTKPTLLSPWYVVQKFEWVDEDRGNMVWYTSMEADIDKVFDANPKHAMLFMNLHAAHRVARAEGADVVVVANESDLKEYRDDA